MQCPNWLAAAVLILCFLCVSRGAKYTRPLIRTLEEQRSEPPPMTESRRVILGVPYKKSRNTKCVPHWHSAYGVPGTLWYIIAAHTGHLDKCLLVDKGDASPNGTATGGLLDLIRGKIDVYCAPRYQELGLGRVAWYLFPFTQRNVCVLVPRVGLQRAVALPALSLVVGAASAAVLGVCGVALRVAYALPVDRVVLDVVRATITGFFPAPRRRVLLVLGFFHIFAMNAFAGCFVGSLVAPQQSTEIDTLERVGSQFDIVYVDSVSGSMIDSIREEDQPAVFLMSKKSRKSPHISMWTSHAQEALKTGKVALLSTDYTLDIIMRYQETCKDGYPLLHKVKECAISPAYLAFPVRKDWPMRDYFSALLQRLVEVGIVGKLYDDSLRKMATRMNLVRLNRGNLPLESRRLTFLHLSQPYEFLGIGLSASFLTFFLELCYSRYRKKAKWHVHVWK